MNVNGASGVPVGLRGINKRYGTVVALDSVDLDIARHEFITLLGPSGSGKTTLLMVVAGFIRPDGGSVMVADRIRSPRLGPGAPLTVSEPDSFRRITRATLRAAAKA